MKAPNAGVNSRLQSAAAAGFQIAQVDSSSAGVLALQSILKMEKTYQTPSKYALDGDRHFDLSQRMHAGAVWLMKMVLRARRCRSAGDVRFLMTCARVRG